MLKPENMTNAHKGLCTVLLLLFCFTSCKKETNADGSESQDSGSLKIRVSTAALGNMDAVDVFVGYLNGQDTVWLPVKKTDVNGTVVYTELGTKNYVVKLPAGYVPLFSPAVKTVSVIAGRESELSIQVNYTGQGNLKTDSSFTIHTQYSAALARERLAQNMMHADFEPVGFYLPAGASLQLQVEQIKGRDLPKLLVGTYSRYHANQNPSEHQLQEGLNTISDNIGGLLYLRYNGIPEVSSVRVTFLSGMRSAPFYQFGKTTSVEWQQMLFYYKDVPDVQLYGGRVIIVTSRENALQYQASDPDELLNTANKVLDLEDDISGLDNSSSLHFRSPHHFLMTESDSPDLFMAATHHRTLYTPSVINVLLTAEGMNTWGPWHELGHQHQQFAWTWSNLMEVTVNIYSLAVQRGMGFTPSRLVEFDNWKSARDYLNRPSEEKDFLKIVDDEGNWVKLAMFDQLRLAYGDNFYRNLHKLTREENPNPVDDEAKMRYFMLSACKIAKKDLTDFFRKWGFRVQETVYKEIKDLQLPAPDTDLTLLSE